VTPDKIDATVLVVMRFLEAADKLRASGNTDYVIGVGSKASGAVRRASLDLTRSLADLRRAQ